MCRHQYKLPPNSETGSGGISQSPRSQRRCLSPVSPPEIRMQLVSYSWKLPAYSAAFLFTVDNSSFFTYNWSFFAYSFSFSTYNWSFLAHSRKVRLVRALRDCKQRSLTVSKQAPTVSRKASPAKCMSNPKRTYFQTTYLS